MFYLSKGGELLAARLHVRPQQTLVHRTHKMRHFEAFLAYMVILGPFWPILAAL